MLPLIPENSFGLFRRQRRYRAGDVVLVDHPRLGRIVKRAQKIDLPHVWLEGVSAQSTSTAAMGPVALDRVLGRLVWLSRPNRF